MGKRLSRRQRLKRDPANQPMPKFKAWAKHSGMVAAIGLPTGLMRLPRFAKPTLKGEHMFRWRLHRYHRKMAAQATRIEP